MKFMRYCTKTGQILSLLSMSKACDLDQLHKDRDTDYLMGHADPKTQKIDIETLQVIDK